MVIKHPARLVAETLVLILLLVLAEVAAAGHSWGNYHWARTSNPFMLQLGDNVSGAWDSYLATTSTDWSVSLVLDITVVTGNTTGRRCRPTSGRIEVCNYSYGNNGWLGLAQIWISGVHITQGTTKVNDTYFNSPPYNAPAWRQLVMCQEVGHDFGLNHQDEAFNNPNLGTCMDYTSNPAGPPSNEHPNTHDYAQLETIYSHFDLFNSYSKSTSTGGDNSRAVVPLLPAVNDDLNSVREWGRLARSSNGGRTETYERDLGHGHRLITHVIWAF